MTNNLATLPPEQRQAIELDKRRWFEANQLTDTKRPDEIRTWLMKQMDDEFREDMRRRLNIIRQNRQARIKNNEASASHSKRTVVK